MNIGKMLVILGLSIAALGALVWLSDRFTGFKLFRLPGDIAVERDGFGFYLPITSMIIISVVLTGIFWLVRLFTR